MVDLGVAVVINCHDLQSAVSAAEFTPGNPSNWIIREAYILAAANSSSILLNWQ